ncbi:hypothetical protein SAMN04488020_11827 [Palleronia marisminoris]|uniref:Uncharacterized protein n=1 Tax=Palleronia marisminoris TaxID=315423 RepID=A0A1Y5TRL7_9RHOB|nr:hypothetical protein [Palleronia marisminoris]SFH50233.1 hypothetical protein SAMN04488020_11827 [Palleronia marisminoris]SLN70368.1 hypothetical protein PAM7066_03570 [Palleronia marisminoris]
MIVLFPKLALATVLAVTASGFAALNGHGFVMSALAYVLVGQMVFLSLLCRDLLAS